MERHCVSGERGKFGGKERKGNARLPKIENRRVSKDGRSGEWMVVLSKESPRKKAEQLLEAPSGPIRK